MDKNKSEKSENKKVKWQVKQLQRKYAVWNQKQMLKDKTAN